MVSMMMTSTPVVISTSICSLKASLASSSCTRPKGANLTPSGPTSPAIITSLKLAKATLRTKSTAALLISAVCFSNPNSDNL